jgi:hypothetical protein
LDGAQLGICRRRLEHRAPGWRAARVLCPSARAGALDGRTLVVNSLALEQSEGRLSGSGQYGLDSGAFVVNVTGRRLQLAPPARGGSAAALPVRASLDLVLSGSGTVDHPRGQGEIAIGSLAWNVVATEADPSSRLTFGKRVTSNTEVIFSQSLLESGGLTWIVSYSPRRNIEIRVVWDDNNNRTYDFRHDISFGGPSGAAEPKPVIAPRVGAVEFAGDAGVSPDLLARELKLSKGDRFDFFAWQEDRDRLAAFFHRQGYFEARVDADRVMSHEPNGLITLTYGVDRGPHTTVEATGYRRAAW